MSNEGIAVPVTEQEVTREAVLEFMEGALAPIDVKGGLMDIAERAGAFVGDVKATLHEMGKKPGQTALAIAITATVAANALAGRAPSSAELAQELARSYDRAGQIDLAPPIPYPFPDALPFPDVRDVPVPPRAIPRTIPRDIPYEGDQAIPLPYTDAVPLDRAIPVDRAVPLNPPSPDRLVDFALPGEMPITPEIKQMLRHEGEKLRFTAYNIKPGDTLSDITFREVFHGNVSPYQTGANNETHFSDEFIQAARDIAIENLAVGSMQPPELTVDGDVIGLTGTYNTNNENMTQEQQVHAFVEQISIVVQSNPGDRAALRDLFDNGIVPELIPHVLRYLKADDNIYLPVYSQNQQEEKADAADQPKGARDNTKYFNKFGARNRRF